MTASPKPDRRHRMSGQINVLQYGRAIAALAVVVFHARAATIDFAGLPLPGWIEAFVSRGYLGVDFFFVLSGFIITHAHTDDPRGALAATRYMSKRLRRIYIPYLPVSIAMIALYEMLPSVSAANRDWSLATSLFLVPTGHPPALQVAWTLVYEMVFYSIFLLSYFFRHFEIGIGIWAVSILATWIIGWEPSLAALKFVLAPMNLEFIAGMAAATAARRLRMSSFPICLAMSLIGVAAFLWSGGDGNTRVLFGLSLAPLVLSLVLLERQGAIPTMRLALVLGNASYAMYLVHGPLQSVAVRALAGLPHWLPTLTICAAVGALGGIAYHYILEKPALARLRLPIEHNKRTLYVGPS